MNNSKICIVSTANVKHMTLISLYTDILKAYNIEFDIVYLDRYGIVEDIGANKVYKLCKNITPKTTKKEKLRYFIEFRNFSKNIINNNNYDLVIVWNTLTSLLLADVLLKNKKKYILNIRDYYFEKNFIIYYLHKQLIRNSIFTTISSKGFLDFLPRAKYIFVHSLNEEIINLNEEQNYTFGRKNDPINIGFLGNVRFYEVQKKIINLLGNDDRFRLWYCGTNSEPLEEYVFERNIKNCEFTGEFSPSETEFYLNKFDIINNIFGSKDISVKTLTPIRLYYSTNYKIPILVNKDTYLGNLVEEFNLGLTLDENELNFADKLYNYFINLKSDEYIKATQKFNELVINENNLFKNKFKSLVIRLKEKNEQ
ncbi:capsular biosynthesis protein [Aerococcaceae bacterium INB8]|uniref:Capsular biosynthesis protein n=1 Tax=Ruoffia halotolerans TaxID=2748684 RepID=A0A839A811_9LACT|nr:hypothetical protein [Ruoffia halotolerans]MBA5730207.1 capsular biosynthesis protein [Ruoffia halotolerans]